MQTNGNTLKGKRILVAEDVAVNQFFLRRILEVEGATVTVVSDGSEAVSQVRADNYDLLLMDIQMPEMDGVTATGIIRSMEDATKAGIPIIALTANALKGDNQRYLDAGMDNYISKPYSPDKLYAVIGGLLPTQEKERITGGAGAVSLGGLLYDLSMIRSMSNGNEEFVRDIVSLFLATIPDDLKALSEAGQASSWNEVSRIAHKLKSAVEHMGIHSLGDPIRQLEDVTNETDTQHIPALIAQVSAIMAEVFDQLKNSQSPENI